MTTSQHALHPFGQLLKKYRHAAALSQEGLAQLAGISTRSVSDLERGITTSPHQDTIHLLADALGLAHEDRDRFIASGQIRVNTVAGYYLPPVPKPLTPLLAREHEESELMDLCSREHIRILTMTGPAGVGKSRLAMQVAALLELQRPGSVGFLSFDTVTDSAQVSLFIAQRLRLTGSHRRDVLFDALRDQSITLVLDTFEHLIEAASTLVALLEACPRVRLLVTSRTPLRVRGESCYPIRPFTLPTIMETATAAQLESHPGIRLFMSLMPEVSTGHAMSIAALRCVAKICHRLDGLPLAIELVAAHTQYLTPCEIADRIQHHGSLSLGAFVWRDLPQRQQTLQATLHWSYSLLNYSVQRVFHSLAVFAGSFTSESVQALWDDSDEALPMQECLASLIDHHFISRIADNQYRLLATIRDFAWSLLLTDPETERLQTRYRVYFCNLTRAAQDGLEGAEQQLWLERLDFVYDDIRAVLTQLQEAAAGEDGLRICYSLWRYWTLRNLLREGLEWTQAFLAMVASTSEMPTQGVVTPVVAHGLYVAGVLAYRLGDLTQARKNLENCLAYPDNLQNDRVLAMGFNVLGLVCTDLDDDAAEPYFQASISHADIDALPNYKLIPLFNLARLYRKQGRYVLSISMYQECLDYYRLQHWEAATANALVNIGDAYNLLGEYALAERYAREGMDHARSAGSPYELSNALITLSDVLRTRGLLNEAHQVIDEAITILRQAHILQDLAPSLGILGNIHHAEGDLSAAEACFHEGIRMATLCESPVFIADCLIGLATIARERGDNVRAVFLLGMAAPMHTIRNRMSPPPDRLAATQLVDALRASLNTERFDAVWSAGTAVPLTDAGKCLDQPGP